MPIQLVSTDTASNQHGLKLLVFGRAGSGKTRLIATAPRPVILSAESGLLSLKGYNLPSITIRNFSDLVETYNWALKSNEAKGFDTLALDSISEIAEVVLSSEKSRQKDPRKAYGEMNEQVMKILRDFRDLAHKHVYFSSKEEWDKDDQSGMMFYRPSMPGKELSKQLPYMFDEVFQLVVGKTTEGQEYRALRTRPDNQTVAKDRSGKLDEWEPADLGAVIRKILGA